MNPFRLLRDTGVGRSRYVFRAWVVAVVPALLLFVALIAIGEATLRPREGMPDGGILAASLLVAPVVETALMLPLAWLLARLLRDREGLCVVALALLAALAHYPGGHWRQVLNALWPFAVYAATLFAWLRRSWRDAFALTAIVHALYNATFLAAGALGVLVSGR